MRMKQTYIAYDDTEFERLEDCLNYEYHHLEIVSSIVRKITFFDRDMNRLAVKHIWSNDELKDVVHDFEKIYMDCHYMDIHEELEDDEDEWLVSEIGLSIPKAAGRYHYDWDFLNEWVKEEE